MERATDRRSPDRAPPRAASPTWRRCRGCSRARSATTCCSTTPAASPSRGWPRRASSATSPRRADPTPSSGTAAYACPEVRCNGSRWREPWPAMPSCSWPTTSPRRSMPRPRSSSGSRCGSGHGGHRGDVEGRGPGAGRPGGGAGRRPGRRPRSVGGAGGALGASRGLMGGSRLIALAAVELTTGARCSTTGARCLDHRWLVENRQVRSTTQSMHAVRASTSVGSTAGYIATRSWLRPSLR